MLGFLADCEFHFCLCRRQVIGYLRLMWPGSIVGLRQEFLEENEEYLWRLGRAHEKTRCENLDELSRGSKGGKNSQKTATRRRMHIRWGSFESLGTSSEDDSGRNDFAMVHVKESAVEMARKARDNLIAAKRRAAKIAASQGPMADEKEASNSKSFYSKCKSTFKIIKGGGKKKKNPLDNPEFRDSHENITT